jgi:FdrA protein
MPGGCVTADHVEARAGAYSDSVTLMQISTGARNRDGVHAALVAMATELNLGLLAGLGFEPPPAASPNDLLIAIRAEDPVALAAALTGVDTALAAQHRVGPAGGQGAELQPRTTGSAVRADGPGLALISVPGQYAFAEAMDALEAGCDVMIFSDNVPVAQEVTLKDRAAELGLIVMGPDCGTAVIGGVGLGFSHALAAGPVGVVAASGTGAQQILCLLDRAGTGVSACVGVGGRDLSAEVAGRSARAALETLNRDPATELIVVVSKPPAPAVAAEIRALAAALDTPVQFAFVAPGEPDLTTAAETVLATLGVPVPDWPQWPATDAARPGTRRGFLRGLFAGGTLCDEAMVIAAERLGPVYSNIPLQEQWRVDASEPVAGNVFIDFGDDRLTAGRAHPMIDQSLRLDRLAAEAADPATAVILLDVVLGHGAHPDPAAELSPAIAAAARAGVAVVVSLISAAADPQDPGRQARALQAAGAHVFASNATAARYACDLAGEQS